MATGRWSFNTHKFQDSEPALGQSFSLVCKVFNFFTTIYNTPTTGKLSRVVSSGLESSLVRSCQVAVANSKYRVWSWIDAQMELEAQDWRSGLNLGKLWTESSCLSPATAWRFLQTFGYFFPHGVFYELLATSYWTWGGFYNTNLCRHPPNQQFLSHGHPIQTYLEH